MKTLSRQRCDGDGGDSGSVYCVGPHAQKFDPPRLGERRRVGTPWTLKQQLSNSIPHRNMKWDISGNENLDLQCVSLAERAQRETVICATAAVPSSFGRKGVCGKFEVHLLAEKTNLPFDSSSICLSFDIEDNVLSRLTDDELWSCIPHVFSISTTSSSTRERKLHDLVSFQFAQAGEIIFFGHSTPLCVHKINV